AEHRSDWAQTCDTQSCQVYGGRATQDAGGFTDLEAATSSQAVDDTRGQVRVFTADGSVARTEFSSSTGGYTAGGTFPAVPDTGDDIAANPNHKWDTDVFVSKVQEAYPTLGTIQTITVQTRNGLGDDGGRALQVKIVGDAGSTTVTADSLRSRLGLKSDWYRIIDPSLNTPAVGIGTLRTGNGVI